MLKLCAGRVKRATFQWRATQRLPLRAEPGRWDAEVIKIEGLDGDPIRRVRPIRRPDIPPNFEIDNHSKQSIEVRTVFRSVYARKRREQNGPRR